MKTGVKLADVVRRAVELSGRLDLRFMMHEPFGFKDWNDQLRGYPQRPFPAVAGRPKPTAGGKKSLPLRNGAAVLVENTTFEKHYRISDLARLWGLGRETFRKLVKDDPGVIKIRMGRKKAHTIYSVPESAAQRIHTRLLNAD